MVNAVYFCKISKITCLHPNMFEKNAFDYTHRRKMHERYETYTQARAKGLAHFEDYELARQQLAYLRYEAIENLAENLLTFEENFTKQGGKIIWAENAQEAQEAILAIIKEQQATQILKAKNPITEEIGLKKYLKDQAYKITETDLECFILDSLALPVQPLSELQISTQLQANLPALFQKKTAENPRQLQMFQEVKDLQAKEVVQTIQKHLRLLYPETSVGITGANFLIADIGGVSIAENEGDARIVGSFANTHIVVAGIDKVIPRLSDLSLHAQMLSANATGQKLPAYQTVFIGGGQTTRYAILLDNGRTKLLADRRLRHALRCIGCGACAEVCPVYRLAGKEAYQSPYTGAVGKVVNEHLFGLPAHAEMTYASTLCGACEEVCPVQIDLPALILHNRTLQTQKDLASPTEKRMVKLWRKYMLQKKYWNRKISHWQGLPKFATVSFSDMYKKRG